MSAATMGATARAASVTVLPALTVEERMSPRGYEGSLYVSLYRRHGSRMAWRDAARLARQHGIPHESLALTGDALGRVSTWDLCEAIARA